MAVRFPEDLENDIRTFFPEYTHQLFGDDETAFGYKGLKILLYYIAGSLSTLFRVEYSSKVDENFDCVEADMTCRGFREYHERLQTFLMWFIETASFIDVDDERWHYFLVFEKYNKDGATLFATVGYMTVYNYYVYPDKTRPRVSQMLILTPFQGQGHGAQLLETVHRYYISFPTVLDITAEDPSRSYLKLRDFVLVKFCQFLPSFSRERLLQGFSEDMAIQAQQMFKINKQHARRVYEILRLLVTDMSDAEQYRSYRLDIKRRLISPYKKKQRDLAKMKKCLRPEELTNQMNQIEISVQHEQLEERFQELVEDYRRVIERLAQE